MSRRPSTTTPAVTERRFRRRNKDRTRYPDPQAAPAVDPHDDPDLLVRRRLALLGDWPAGYGDDTEPFAKLTANGLISACRSCGGPTQGERPAPPSMSDDAPAPRSQWTEVCAECSAGRWRLGAFLELLVTVTGASDAVIAEARRQVEAGEWLLPVVWYADAPASGRRTPIRRWSHLAHLTAHSDDAKQYRWPSVDGAGGTVWVPVTELAELPTVPDVFARGLDRVERQLYGRKAAPPPEAWGVEACWWCGVGRAPRASWRRPRGEGGLVWCGVSDACPTPDSDNASLTAPKALTRLFWGPDPEPDNNGDPSRVTNLEVDSLRQAGFRFWGEIDGAAPNAKPWAHVALAPLIDAFERHLALQWEAEQRRDWHRHRDPGVTVIGPDGRPGIQQPWLNPDLRDEWFAGSPYPALVERLFPLEEVTPDVGPPAPPVP